MLRRVARDYQKLAATYGAGLDDLLQAGFLGALRAAQTWRPGGLAFGAWASLRARDAMRHLCRGVFCLSLDAPMPAGVQLPAAPDWDHGAGLGAVDARRLLARMGAEDAALLRRRYGLGGGAEDAAVDKKALWAALKRARRAAGQKG
jgi:DNA-directed RNA polymerase specialized sigma24 family protein